MKKLLAIALTLVLALSLSAPAFAVEKLSLGGTTPPHAEVLDLVVDDMAALGYDLEVLPFSDWPLLNPSTSSGELNGNFFQHLPYLDGYNAEVAEDEQLVGVIPVHYEPYGIYPGTKSDLSELADGDVICITNDASNTARALLLLESAGLLTLPEGTTLSSPVTVEDIVSKVVDFEITELNAELIPSAREDCAFAVINGNYALGAGLNIAADSLVYESPESEAPVLYTNYVVVRAADQDAEWVDALAQCLHTEEVSDYLKSVGVVPAF